MSLRIALLLLCLCCSVLAKDPVWQRLTPIPDAEGFAGPFAGVASGRLIVAGGANFPDAKPWEGGKKVWYDSVFALTEPEGTWEKIGKLPAPLGYGASITVPEGVLLIGGSDAVRHHTAVRRLTLVNGACHYEDLPALPMPLANHCAALLGRTVYVAGGIVSADSTTASPAFLSLDLDHLDAGWHRLDPCPGRERMLAAAGAVHGRFILAGGAALKPGADGKPEREWLQDVWAYTPGGGWQRLPDAPRVSVAAPSPMPLLASGQLLLLGGDDGAQVKTPPTEHQGFPKTAWALDGKSGTWAKHSEIPAGLVTTTAVQWQGRVILPGGELKPGIRSTLVLSLSE